MIKFFRSSLIRKIALMSVLNIVLVCMIIISMGAYTLSTNMSHAIETEMQLSATAISTQIEQIFETAHATAIDLQYAAEAAFTHSDIYVPTEGVNSMVRPDVNVSMVIHDFEKYVTQSMFNALNHSTDLAGMGILLEPNGIWPGVENYSVYVTPGMDESDIAHFLDYGDFSGIEYYAGSKMLQNTYVTAPYLEGNTMVVSMCEPIFNAAGSFIGIVGTDVSVAHFGSFLAVNPDYPTMNASILDHNLNIAYTTRTDSQTGDPLSALVSNTSDMEKIKAGIATNQPFQVDTQAAGGEAMTRFFDPVIIEEYTWWSVTSLEKSDLNSSTLESVTSLSVTSLILLGISVVAQIAYLQYTLKDIRKVVDASEQIRSGSLDVELSLKTGDEIQLLGDSFSGMAAGLRSMVLDIKHVLAEVSAKNLDVTPEAYYVGDFSEIQTSMQTIVGTMNDIIYEINMSSRQVAQGASNVTEGSMTLSHGATEQAESVESLSNRVTDVSEKITENAENSQEANEFFTGLATEIEEGNEKMKHMIIAMEDISASSQQISKIMKTINDIASQTNILALNASVEAARAGEAGKGFAVVASEVKMLAQKSAEAAKTTSKLVRNSVEVVDRGAGLAMEVEDSLSSIIENVARTRAIIENITTASNEQAGSIHEITTGIHDITGVVQNNSAAAEESAAASEELLAQSESLQTMVSEFKLK